MVHKVRVIILADIPECMLATPVTWWEDQDQIENPQNSSWTVAMPSTDKQ